jgi:hypothetical protein
MYTMIGGRRLLQLMHSAGLAILFVVFAFSMGTGYVVVSQLCCWRAAACSQHSCILMLHLVTPALLLQTIAAAFSHKSPFTASLEQQPKMEAVKRALVAPDAAEAAAAGALSSSSSSSSSKGSKGSATAAGPGALSPGAANALRLAAGQQSDHLLLVAAFELWRQAKATGGERAAAQVRRCMLQ